MNEIRWIFSGIGVFVLGLIVSLISRSKSNKKFIQKNKKQSENYQAENMYFGKDVYKSDEKNDTRK